MGSPDDDSELVSRPLVSDQTTSLQTRPLVSRPLVSQTRPLVFQTTSLLDQTTSLQTTSLPDHYTGCVRTHTLRIELEEERRTEQARTIQDNNVGRGPVCVMANLSSIY